jgi:hypothetical protein
MPYEKGPELSGARIEDADFSNARLHAPNFEGAKITDAWFCDADISGDLEGLRLNGSRWRHWWRRSGHGSSRSSRSWRRPTRKASPRRGR